MMHVRFGDPREHNLQAGRVWNCARCREGLLASLPSEEHLRSGRLVPAREQRDEVAAEERRVRRAEARML